MVNQPEASRSENTYRAQVDSFLNVFQLCSPQLLQKCYPFAPKVRSGPEILANGAILSHFAVVSYREENEVQPWAAFAGVKKLPRFLSSDAVQLYVFTLDEAHIVAFRGSEKKLNDWLTNFNVGFSEDGIHVGYDQGVISILEPLAALINDGKPVWLTGHSAGGALAVVASYHLKKKFNIATNIMTFAAPKVFHPSRVKDYMHMMAGQSYFRYIYGEDLVTETPGPRFKQAGHEQTTVYFRGNTEQVAKNLGLEGQADYRRETFAQRTARCRAFSNKKTQGEWRKYSEAPLDYMQNTLSYRVNELFKGIGNALNPQKIASGFLCRIKDHCMLRYLECTVNNLKHR